MQHLCAFQWTTLASRWPMKERIPASFWDSLDFVPLAGSETEKRKATTSCWYRRWFKKRFWFLFFDWAFLWMCFDHVSPNIFKTTSVSRKFHIHSGLLAGKKKIPAERGHSSRHNPYNMGLYRLHVSQFNQFVAAMILQLTAKTWSSCSLSSWHAKPPKTL